MLWNTLQYSNEYPQHMCLWTHNICVCGHTTYVFVDPQHVFVEKKLLWGYPSYLELCRMIRKKTFWDWQKVLIFFLFHRKNMLWYSFEHPNEYPQHMCLWRRNFYGETPLIWSYVE